jgi:cytochrome oxidase assembly protein ShyY1
VIRTALKPAWLALLALLVAVVVAFYQLGMWQIGVSSNTASRELAEAQAARPTEPLAQATVPHQTFPDDGAGLSVRAEGEYVAELQFLVPDRILDGQDGYWVVTPLRTEASGSPALIPVMRGFVTDPGLADVPVSAPVVLEGTLAPAEAPVYRAFPDGQRGAIDTADLANDWDAPIYNAFIFLVEESPALTSPSVQQVPPPVFGESGIEWRNFGYGLQWFVFAAFACYMYYRFLRDATRQENEQTEAEAGPDHDHPDAPHTPPAAAPVPSSAATREGDPV